MVTKLARTLLAAAASAASLLAANPDTPADFTVTTDVVAANPPRFGVNLNDPPQFNNFVLDSGFEPTIARRLHRATGGGADYIENIQSNGPTVWSPGTAHYNTMADGFFDGATVRVYRTSTTPGGALTHVRTARVTDYVTDGFRRLNHVPVRASEFVDNTGVPGVLYEYQVRAVTFSRVVSTNWSDPGIFAAALVGQAPAQNTFWTGTFLQQGNNIPATPTAVTATSLPGAVRLDWADNTEANLAGYFVYRRSRSAGERQRVWLDSEGPEVRAGDYYFIESSWVEAPTDFMHDRIGTYTLNDPWRLTPGPWGNPNINARKTRDGSTACPENGGRSSLRLETTDAQEVSIRQPRFSAPQFFQNAYPALEPGRTYRIDVWLKQEGIPNGRVNFRLDMHYSAVNHNWTVGSSWQRFTHTFVAPPLPATRSLSHIILAFTGPGVLWVDNCFIYEDADGNPQTSPAFELRKEAIQALADYRPGVLRIWPGNDNTYGGTSMDDFTTPEPVTALHWESGIGRRVPDDPYKLPTALRMCRALGAQPWLIIGSGMSEDEWRHLIEYLAAPYDPAVDSPATKPYAARRYYQGQFAPWTDVFETIHFEYGNEMWNGFFQWILPNGDVYGQFAEHFFQAAKSSPYFSAVAGKVNFIANGFWVQGNPFGYGHAAMRSAPSAHTTDLAPYLGWNQEDLPNPPRDSDYQDFMLFSPSFAKYHADQHAASRDASAARGRPYRLAIYEGGPGYGNPAPGINPDGAPWELMGKSLAGAVSTLDAFLYHSQLGVDPICYFTFAPGYYWASHSAPSRGYNPHTSWQALRMRNRRVTGSMMRVAQNSAPTADVPTFYNDAGFIVAPASPNTPLTGCYAFRDGNRWFVFTLSRKINGDTPVTLRLPFQTVSRATLYKLTGDPRTGNSTSLVVSETREFIRAFSPDFSFTLPPGSIYLHVFEDVSPNL